MAFSLFNIFKAGLLCANAVVVLHPKRFLAKYGLNEVNPHDDGSALRNQTVQFLQAAGYLKVPLIAINVIVIIVELLFG